MHFSKGSIVVKHPISQQKISSYLIGLSFHFLKILFCLSLARILRHYNVHELLNELLQVFFFIVIGDTMPNGILIQPPLEECNGVKHTTRLGELAQNFIPHVVGNHHDFHTKSYRCFVPRF